MKKYFLQLRWHCAMRQKNLTWWKKWNKNDSKAILLKITHIKVYNLAISSNITQRGKQMLWSKHIKYLQVEPMTLVFLNESSQVLTTFVGKDANISFGRRLLLGFFMERTGIFLTNLSWLHHPSQKDEQVHRLKCEKR